MKKITLIVLIASILAMTGIMLAHADQVTLAWDAVTPAPDGYRLFVAPENSSFDYSKPAWQGAATACTIPNLSAGQTYHFTVRAYKGQIESASSNEVVYTVPLPAEVITYPKQPRTLIIRFGE